jgi:hypothetical protein
MRPSIHKWLTSDMKAKRQAASYQAALDSAIEDQRGAVWLYFAWAGVEVAAGLVVIAVGFAPGLAGTQSLIQVGGGLVASISGFPILQVIRRRERITALKFLRDQFSGRVDGDQLAYAEQRTRQYIDAILDVKS